MKRAPLLYVMAIMTVILLANHSALPSWICWYNRVPCGDTIGHFFLFGLLATALTVGLNFKRVTLFSRDIFLGSLVSFLLVTGEEFSQQFIAARTFSFLDLAANYLGIWVLGQCLCSFLLKRGSA